MEVKAHTVASVEEGSIAAQLGIMPGDQLLAVNKTSVSDVLDYHYLINDTELVLTVRKPDGTDWEYEIEKDYYEDPGLVFSDGLMDDYHSCTNKCVFCFIDQMPPGMRKSLYFKDDDSRLSFFQGNYITLTNLKEADVERMIRYRLSPVNISVHTTNPALRVKMLNNRFAGDALKILKRMYDAQIVMNAQIVLCKGINDREELHRSIRDLSAYLPYMQSLSVVPVGLTKYREGLYPLDRFMKEDAKKVLETVHKWQEICYDKYGVHFVHASDEWYLLAQEEIPPEERYDDYPQLENGVGMMRLLQNEFEETLEMAPEPTPVLPRFKLFRSYKSGEMTKRVHRITIATGELAAPLLRKLSLEYMLKYPDTMIEVHAIRNDFFGPDITVSGLVTGQDLIAQLSGVPLGETVLIPCNMLRSDEDVFLDDITLKEVIQALGVPVVSVPPDGESLFNAIQKRSSL